MKKLLLPLMLILLVSCSHKVQVSNEFIITKSNIWIGDKFTMYETMLYFYNENENLIKSIPIGAIHYGQKSDKYKVPKNASYYKVAWCMLDKNNKTSKMIIDNVDETYVVSAECNQVDEKLNIYILNNSSKIKTQKGNL